MILGGELLTALVLYIRFHKHVIIGGAGPYAGCLAPMVDVNNYDFKYPTDKKLN